MLILSSKMGKDGLKRKNTDPHVPATKVSKTAMTARGKGAAMRNIQFSLPSISDSQQSSSSQTGANFMNDSQSSDSTTITTNLLCGNCNQHVSNDKLDVTALQCCLCDVYFHGSCLNVDDSLLSFLHVVAELGG